MTFVAIGALRVKSAKKINIYLISQLKYVLGTQKNRLNETVL